jgi:hypothetical protein
MVRAMRHALKGLAALIVTLATPGWLLAQGWVAPLGIPHPGDWFLKTEGNVQLVTTGGASRTFTGTGTAAAPVIFRGVNAP